MSIQSNLAKSLYTGFVDYREISLEEYRPSLLINNSKTGQKVLTSIVNELSKCDEFFFSTAFITNSGVASLINVLIELEEKGIKGKIIASQYQNFTEPKALKRLIQLKNIQVKIVVENNYHTKGYIFRKDDRYTLIVGSSNLTQDALSYNKEWNIKVSSMGEGSLLRQTMNEFNYTFDNAVAVTEEWINEYQKIYQERDRHYSKQERHMDYSNDTYDNNTSTETNPRAAQPEPSYTVANNNITTTTLFRISPNKMQIEALGCINNLRTAGKNKALLISATGTGKTYLSAFDARIYQPRKLLFVVHRENITRNAMKSFQRIFENKVSMGILSGNSKDYESDFLFCTIQTLSKDNVMKSFPPNHFDYIVIDEAHRSGASSYQNILEYFTPKFLLGMTATPERMDGFDIFKAFDHNIAYEIRLNKALEENMLCTFHYYGISDIEVEGELVNEATSFNSLISSERIERIVEKSKLYGCDHGRVKGLVFCSRVEEARELSKQFNRRGFSTIALDGSSSEEQREAAINQLEEDKNLENSLDYIFTVDIFNEGVDIPSINQIIMLRPTQSSIIFVQQLGRGLRKKEHKEYLVVIDFIGNYTNNFLIPIALYGDNSYNKDTLRKLINSGNSMIPGASTVNFDYISRQRIYAAIDTANFSDVKLIKEQYQNLKNMLGRIPKLEDFEKFGSIDVMRIFENKSLGSYHNFLKKYDKDYITKLTSIQEEMLEFISQKIANGKRIHELQLLKSLIHFEHGIMKIVTNDLMEKYGKTLTHAAESNMVSVLTNQFVTNEVGKNKFAHCIFIEKDGDDYKATNDFYNAIQSQEFCIFINELLDFGIRRNQNMYSDTYKNTNLEINRKYTYEDVCKLLDWNKNIVAQNIGGYKYDEGTNTFPVFINYNKDESISDSIKYEDRFISPSRLIALSKQPRTRESKDVQQIYHAKEKGTKIYLFMRKNKDDNTSKEFYFLGEIATIGEPEPIIIKNTDKNAVEITYQLETPVREDVYEYLTK